MKNLLKKIQSKMPSFSKKEKGATMVEYAIMVALIAVVSIAMITLVGKSVNSTFQNVNNSLTGMNNAG
ncbi:Flp family type IVb pilin [Methylobacter svalbardensis]|uniref:Flp family type IVb pilin n=1 Tax=Methylobacter svalbardensis TaxID=3080016 RepID=UPI0030EC9098